MADADRSAQTWMRAVMAGAVTVVVAAALWWVAAGPAEAFHGLDTARTAGEDRMATAAEVAREAHPDGALHALVAQAGDFPDALAASALTRNPDAPLLLTPSDELADSAREALNDLGVEAVTIVGGREAVSEEVAVELEEEVDDVERVAGPNRFATAVAIADAVERGEGRSVGHLDDAAERRTAFLVNGRRFPDALAASSPAASAADPYPILLTEQDRLPEVTEQALEDLGIQQVIIVGGSAAVSDDVEARLGGEPHFINTRRVAGRDRVATAAAVAGLTRQLPGGADAGFGYDGANALLARGDDFADALAAGPLGGLRGAPVLLTPEPGRLGEPVAAWLGAQCPGLERIRAIGGTAAMSDDVLADAADCHVGRSHSDYLVAPQEPLEGAPGEALELDVALTQSPWFTDPVDIALLPCEAVDSSGSGIRFADADGDRTADGLGETDTGHARIVRLDGQETDTRVLRDVEPSGRGVTEFAVESDAPDCTIPVVFDDADDDGELRVDDQGLALEFYGWGSLSWSDG